jgi:hypothetical protein
MTTIEEQRAAALDAANQVRVDRAKLRQRIKAGEVTASSVLEDMPDCVRGAAAFHFLTYIPDIDYRRRSASRAFTLLRKAQAPGHKRLDQLTPGQLARLLGAVREFEQRKHPAERGMT